MEKHQYRHRFSGKPAVHHCGVCMEQPEHPNHDGFRPSDGVKPYVAPKPVDLIAFIEERLAAHEGGAADVRFGYDDATFDYVITQKNSRTQNYDILGCSRDLKRAIELAISGKRFD